MYYNEGGRKKNVYFWIIVLIALVIVLNTPFIKRTRITRTIRTVSSNIIYPFKYLGNAIYDSFTSRFYDFIRVKGIQKENEQLRSELEEYKAKVVSLDQLSNENEKLRNSLYFRAKNLNSRFLPAEIIGRSGNNWFEFVEINRGSADNIAVDTAVINKEGLVGRVCEVSKYSSKVLLVTDPTSAVSIINADTGDMGIASGNSVGPLRIRYMSANANVSIGDRIVTSGMSDIFPKGIYVGTVISVDKKDYDIFQKVQVAPVVSFSKLDKVFVIIR